MITEKELLAAIEECEAEPITPNKVSKLADFYIIYDHLFGQPYDSGYSYQAPIENTIEVKGDSDFLKTVNGMKSEKVWAVMDELMTVLEATNPRLYDGVMRKLED